MSMSCRASRYSRPSISSTAALVGRALRSRSNLKTWLRTWTPATALLEPRCAPLMETVTLAMSFLTDHRRGADCAIASTLHRCVSFPSMSSRARATATTPSCSIFGTRSENMSASTERAILAGGCFWGMQDLFRRQDGVLFTRVGYTGGDVPNATYRNHGTHAEAIEIVFDPQRVSYRRLLEFFFQIHDPTTLNRQGNDHGASYRSAIFYTSDEQRRIANDTINDVNASGRWPGTVVT